MLRKILIGGAFRCQNHQLRRTLCQVARTCWSCNASLSNNSEIFCSNCHSIQKLPKIVKCLWFNWLIIFLISHVSFRITLIYSDFKSSIKLIQTISRQGLEAYKVRFIPTNFPGRAKRSKRWAQNGARLSTKRTRHFSCRLNEENIYWNFTASLCQRTTQ